MNKEYKNFFGGLDSDIDIDSSKVIDEAPQDKESRIIDFKTRDQIHKILLEVSRESI